MIRAFMIAAALGLSAQAAAQACDGFTVTAQNEGALAYDPASATPEPLRISLQASPPLDESCRQIPVVIEPRDGEPFPPRLRFGGETLALLRNPSPEVIQAGRGLELTADARERLVSGQAVHLTLSDIQAGQFAAPGLYVAELQIRAGDAITPFTLQVTVAPSVLFVNDSAGLRHDMDLGDPSLGARTASSTFMFRTNAAMRVSVRSHHAGRLVHEMGRGYGTIDYQAQLNQTPLNLTAAHEGLEIPYRPTDGVRTGIMRVDVPHQPNLVAGRYFDTIVMTVTPY
jgi:hypothetical protein